MGLLQNKRGQVAWEGPGHAEPCWLWCITFGLHSKYSGLPLRVFMQGGGRI